MRPLALLLAAAALLAGCGRGDEASPLDPAIVAERELPPPPSDLPRDLRELRAQASELLDGGAPAFERRLEELEGHPVVVNKWASWCAPCRAEFPFFRSQALEREGEVAFMGVDSTDNRGDAAAFLTELPLPYPSYLDPELEVAEVFNGVAAFPTTAFYDARGELAYVKQGGYASEELLAEDIERYALSGPRASR